MTKKLTFYVKYAFRSLRRERQRSLFATFCVAVGVGTVVAMQSLGMIITATIMENIRASVGGDIVLSAPYRFFDQDDLAFLAHLKDEGKILAYTATIEAHNVAAKKRGDIRKAMPRCWFVDPTTYPLYGVIRAVKPKNAPLNQLLVEPHDVVVSQNLSKVLDLQAGDELVLADAAEPYFVRGIVLPYVAESVNIRLPGFIIFRHDIAREFLRLSSEETANKIYIKTASAKEARAILPKLADAIPPYTRVTTAAEREDTLKENARSIRRLIILVGLLSLLIGGAGVANTMLVIAGRRLREMAALKSLGLKGRETVHLFLVEAVMLGLAGSLIGAPLGLMVNYGVKGLAERFLGLGLNWRIYPLPIGSALSLGLVSAAVFGFVPALAVSKVRPALILRQEEGTLPRLGRLNMSFVTLLLTGTMGLIASLLLGNVLMGLTLAYGTLIVFVILVPLLNLLVRLVAKLPSLGRINLKLALRGLTRHRSRTAIILLALSIGIFAVGLITIVAKDVKWAVRSEVARKVGFNIMVFLRSKEDAPRALQVIESTPGFLKTSRVKSVDMKLKAVNGDANRLEKRLRAAAEGGNISIFDLISSISGRELTENIPDIEIDQGRNLTAADEGKEVVLISSSVAEALAIGVGDVLNIDIDDRSMDLTIIGVQKKGALALDDWLITSNHTLDKVRPEKPRVRFLVQVSPDHLETAITQLSLQLPDAVVLDISSLITSLDRLIDQYTVFPTVLATLTLFAAAALIANSVALAIVERRREMGIMKAIGAKSQRVLSLLLLENGLVGLVGGTLGVGLAILIAQLLKQNLFEASPRFDLLTAFALVALSTTIALSATLLSGWGPVRERPLAMLRYE